HLGAFGPTHPRAHPHRSCARGHRSRRRPDSHRGNRPSISVAAALTGRALRSGADETVGEPNPPPKGLTRILRDLSIESRRDPMADTRKESDSLGVVEVPAAKLWGGQSQRSLEHFSIGRDLIPREMITAYAILKKAAPAPNHAGQRLR